MSNPEEQKAHRILSAGNLSGAQLDDMWKRLAPSVVPAVAPWWKRARSVWLGALPLLGAAAALAVMTLGPDRGFVQRGHATRLTLEPSCGHAVPCRVGERVYLKVRAGAAGYVTVLLPQKDGAWVPAQPSTPTDGTTELVWPGAVVPDADDVPTLNLRGVWTEAALGNTPLSEAQLPSASFALQLRVLP